ncbi:MAG: hypothetical protein BRC42_14620 [Cyanobacteria bacterium QS_1_48_34]|nr:MAG: hypothetical protein BRC42_14620 [Cyanobacteria bacterium QS_1_48_34]
MNKTLYDQDYYLWLEHTTQLLKQGKFSGVDIPNLIDEIEVHDQFEDSPSLKRDFNDVFQQCYANAREEAADETGLSIDTFPIESPFLPEQSLNTEYLPS